MGMSLATAEDSKTRTAALSASAATPRPAMASATAEGANLPSAALPVRIERDLYEALVKVAKKHRRSITAEVNDIIGTFIEVSEPWALPEEEESK